MKFEYTLTYIDSRFYTFKLIQTIEDSGVLKTVLPVNISTYYNISGINRCLP